MVQKYWIPLKSLYHLIKIFVLRKKKVLQQNMQLHFQVQDQQKLDLPDLS